MRLQGVQPQHELWQRYIKFKTFNYPLNYMLQPPNWLSYCFSQPRIYFFLFSAAAVVQVFSSCLLCCFPFQSCCSWQQSVPVMCALVSHRERRTKLAPGLQVSAGRRGEHVIIWPLGSTCSSWNNRIHCNGWTNREKAGEREKESSALALCNLRCDPFHGEEDYWFFIIRRFHTTYYT